MKSAPDVFIGKKQDTTHACVLYTRVGIHENTSACLYDELADSENTTQVKYAVNCATL